MKKRLLLGAAAFGIASAVVVKHRLPLSWIAFESVPFDRPLEDGSEFVDIDGLRVRTLVRGSGEPTIVLLHGFAASVFTWHKVIDQLANHGTVIAFDRPAYGFTSRPTHPGSDQRNPYSLESSVELTLQMLNHCDVERAFLVGHSAGGTLAALVALEHPERVQRLVLVAPAVYTDVPPPPWMHRLFESTVVQHCGPSIAQVIARFTIPIMQRVWHDPSLITPEIVEGYLAPFRCESWAAGMWEVVRANQRVNLRSRIGVLSVPTLMITGDHDRVVPTKHSIRAAREIPGAELVVIPECGHIPQEEKPDEFLEAVVSFIERADGGLETIR